MKIRGIRKFSTPKIAIGQKLLPPLSSVSVVVVLNPLAVTVLENNTATFTCSGIASNKSTVFYNWQNSLDNVSFSYIKDAKFPVYTSIQYLSNNQTFYRCALSASESQITFTNSVLLSVYSQPPPPPVNNYIGWYVLS